MEVILEQQNMKLTKNNRIFSTGPMIVSYQNSTWMEDCSDRFSNNFLKITKDNFSNMFQNLGFLISKISMLYWQHTHF